MEDEIKMRLDRIEQYAVIAAKNVLNVREAALVTGLSVRTLRSMAYDKAVPTYKPNRNLLYFKKSELEEWMTRNRTKSAAEIDSEAEALLLRTTKKIKRHANS